MIGTFACSTGTAKSACAAGYAAQLNKMLEEGTIDPTAQASRYPKEGFRSLSTFKEFQKAFVKQSKKAADMQSERYRNIYKKIKEKERLRRREGNT